MTAPAIGQPTGDEAISSGAHRYAAARYPSLRMFISGQWCGGSESVAVIDPSNETMLGELPLACEGDLDRAISAVEAGFAVWRKTPAVQRARVINAAADWLRNRREEWASLITLELGKPLSQARLEVDTACEILEWNAEEGRRLYGRQFPERVSGIRMASVVEPVGPVAAITGWNAPAITPCRKIGAALAAGCSVLLKPSEATPACALMIGEAMQEAGLPAGVLNIVFGEPAAIGSRLATDTALRALTFTGSTQVGKQLASQASATLKRLVLELGGHAPVLVFDDVDVVSVAQAVVAAKVRNSGQVCTSPTRIWVQEQIYEEFSACFTRALLRLSPDEPFNPSASMGPLQNRRRLEAVQALVADATRNGARAIVGTSPAGRGYWYPPTVLVDVPAGARVLHEEPFGPVAVLGRFASMDQAMAEANRLPLGLAAYAFTRDLAVAERLTNEIQAGTLAINHLAASFPETPFGGLKDSGLGTEGGHEGVAAFTQTRFVSVAT
jgi:succinate-semialdehyde dehydrogenase / glutarate-semialdehyde dehydrogenase